MSRNYFLSIVLFISTFPLTLVPLAAQEEEGEIIIISERVGKEIDQEEAERFKFFQNFKGFQKAVCYKLPDNNYIWKITFVDEKTNELKVKYRQDSESSINKYRNYIDRFEEIQARREEERGGEIIIISEQVGNEIDQEEWDKYKLFQDIKGFQSATFFKFPSDKYILKIMYKEEQMDELKIDRIPQSKESINKYRDNINHFGEIKAQQDTVYQEPGTALFWEAF